MAQGEGLPLADQRALRTALGQFATGVTVVTCNTPDGPLGITANSFASVSLDPPLVLWSPAKASKRYPAFVEASHFAIHILSHAQLPTCTSIAQDGRDFTTFDWSANANDVPLINGCLARFECARHAAHDGGDHTIIIGLVTKATMGEGAPLVFAQGAYGRFEELG